METLRKKEKMLETKSTVTEMKTSFDGLFSELGIAKEIIIELGNKSVETTQIEILRDKRKR